MTDLRTTPEGKKIVLKYLVLVRKALAELWDEYTKLYQAAKSKKESHKIMLAYDKKVKRTIAKIERQGWAELKRLAGDTNG